MLKNLFKSLIVMALFASMPLTTYAASVHKWVDENGVTHYSDQAPEHYVAQVDEIKISNNYSQSNAQDDYYSVSNQWARMHAERVARKKLQLEKAKLKQSQSEVTPQVVYFNQDEDSSGQGYYPVFANSFGRFGNKYYSNGFRKSFNNNYNGRNCKLPRNSKIRTGLSLTIR